MPEAASTATAPSDAPVLSVVVTAGDDPEGPSIALEHLLSDPAHHFCEIIVADGRDGGGAHLSDRPGLRYLSLPGHSMPEAKAKGAYAATADHIAFLEAKSPPRVGWLTAASEAIKRQPGVLLGGPVLFGGTDNAANHAVYAFEYSAFTLESVTHRPGQDLPGCNMILPRKDLLETCGDILDAMGLNKPFCQERMKAAGFPVVLLPELSTELHTEYRIWPLLTSRACWGRCFGGHRITRVPWPRRMAYRLLGPAIAVMLLVRHQNRLGSIGPNTPRASTRLVVALLSLSWALGEWIGSITGPGKSCSRLH